MENNVGTFINLIDSELYDSEKNKGKLVSIKIHDSEIDINDKDTLIKVLASLELDLDNFSFFSIYTINDKDQMKVLMNSNEGNTSQDIWDLQCIKLAITLSKGSHCVARKVGCVISEKRSIISTGINGSSSGKTNCDSLFAKHNDDWYKLDMNNIFHKCEKNAHHKWSNINEIHAEMNAINNLCKTTALNNVDMKNTTIYITHSPCFNCAKTIVSLGFKRIVSLYEYDDSNKIFKYLNENNVEHINIFNYSESVNNNNEQLDIGEAYTSIDF